MSQPQLQGQDLGLTEEHGQRGAQIVGERREQGVAQSFRLHLQLGLLGFPRQLDPLQGDGDEYRIELQQSQLLGDHQQPLMLWLYGQHSQHLLTGDERHQAQG